MMTRCHGDYHPKNVIVGQDVHEDQTTAYAAAIDRKNAVFAPRAFDVGWFVAHCDHQFEAEPRVLQLHSGRLFLEEYRREAVGLEKDFDAVERLLSKARGALPGPRQERKQRKTKVE